MNGKIKYGKSIIQYNVIKSKRRKTSEISIDQNNVIVRTPIAKSNQEIKKLMETKARWIFKNQLKFADRKKRKQIKVKTRTSEYLEKRTWKLASKIGLIPSKVVVKKLKSRWGSATKTRTINLNDALTKTPLPVIDYVIIHELCHLKIDDHSRIFWNLLHNLMPNYRKHKEWLEINFKHIIED